MNLNSDSTIAIIGAGAMGSGIAQVAAQAGHQVVLIDTNQAALDYSAASLAKSLDTLVARGKKDAEGRDTVLGRIHRSTNLAATAPADLVIEAIVEDLNIKTGLLSRLSNFVSDDAVLVSNTSSLSINAMAARIGIPERFAGLHFFNPVPVMKLVEVVPGVKTAAAVTSALLTLMKAWGKVGVRVSDVPGFIVNRVARPYYAEGFAALGEGIDPAAIDHALTSAGAFRMGPLALADMIGHDVNYVVARSVYDAYDGKTRFRPQATQQALFESGKLGKKNGSGVYDYSASLPEPAFVAPGRAPAEIEIAAHCDGIAAVIELARDAGIGVTTNTALAPDSLQVAGIVMALSDGRNLASRSDVDVLLDHARDFASAPTWVISARTEKEAAVAAGLAHALGKQIIQIPDRPGQIVLRTLAQLANAAADAVADEVASAEDINAAMRFGANHPEGPLKWAARFGHVRVSGALDNIAAELADDMYRPAPFLKIAADA